MRQINHASRWLLGLVSLFLVGCLMCEVPLIEPEQAIDAKSIYGTWILTDVPKDSNQVLSMTVREPLKGLPKNTFELESTNVVDGKEESRTQFFAYIGKIGKDEYMHFVPYGEGGREAFDYDAWKKKSDRTVQIWQIKREKDTFSLFGADSAKLGELLQKAPDVRITKEELPVVRKVLEEQGATGVYVQDKKMTFVPAEKVTLNRQDK